MKNEKVSDETMSPEPLPEEAESVRIFRQHIESFPTHDDSRITIRLGDGRALLRAVQAPRLTGEQVSALITARRNLLAAECPVTVSLLAAAFPEAFAGEVGRG